MKFVIDDQFLNESQALTKVYHKGETIIEEGSKALFFYYLKEGDLSVFNYGEDGKEFIQHQIQKNSFFGEPAVLLERPFPGSVEVTSAEATVFKIERKNFLDYLMRHPEQMLEFTKSMAQKSIIKTTNIRNLIFLNPEDRLLRHFSDLKKAQGTSNEDFLIDMTRQDLANLTGLRIETVIRTIKKMERDGKLIIKKGKIYF